MTLSNDVCLIDTFELVEDLTIDETTGRVTNYESISRPEIVFD